VLAEFRCLTEAARSRAGASPIGGCFRTEAATSFGPGRTRRAPDRQLTAQDGAFDGLREIDVRGVVEEAYDLTSRVARRCD
jgi:hypothetical protein